MKTTDTKIKELMELVANKKAAISQAEKSNWKTNCVFSGGSLKDTTNIQTVKDISFFVNALSFLIGQKQNYQLANELLGTNSVFKYSGYTYEDWLHDFKQRITQIQIADKKKELASLEERLNKIISPELRAEMEIEEISKALN